LWHGFSLLSGRSSRLVVRSFFVEVVWFFGVTVFKEFVFKCGAMLTSSTTFREAAPAVGCVVLSGAMVPGHCRLVENKKAAKMAAFLFLPSIFRIPSLGIKPAKFLSRRRRGSGLECGVITLDFEVEA
jgi:hypothetical protein